MKTNYIPHSKIINITVGDNVNFGIWINTTEGTFGTNNSFITDSNGITGIFVKSGEKYYKIIVDNEESAIFEKNLTFEEANSIANKLNTSNSEIQYASVYTVVKQ